MTNKTIKIIGPPGTGKTRALIEEVKKHLDAGIPPDRIGYLAFTRKAANEARDRAKDAFNFTDEDLPYFRTIHSFAFRQLGLSTHQMVGKEDYDYLGDLLGLEIRGSFTNYEDGYYESPVGDKIVFIESVARNMKTDIEEAWRMYDNESILLPELKRYAKTFEQYKVNKMLLDYTDILSKFVKEASIPKLDVLFIDEAQDLSPLQWEAVNAIKRKTDIVYFAGDDDQCIYRWAGADVSKFISLEGDVRVLSVSYRLPDRIREYASTISSKINNRLQKRYDSNLSGGKVEYVVDIEEVDLSDGTWFLVARNSYLLKRFEGLCMREGFSFENFKGWSPVRSDALIAIRLWTSLTRGKSILGEDFNYIKAYRSGLENINLVSDVEYTMEMIPEISGMSQVIWHKALDKISPRLREYFIAALRRNENLISEPRIKISTIHGVKGGEADNVLILPDMSKQTYETMLSNEEDEHRVFYVAATRAKKALYLALPQTNLSYDL